MQTQDPGASGAALSSLLYVSVMTSPAADEVARICERSRENNLRDDITGLLLFDGRDFCQFVEGPPTALGALRDRLERDTRHHDMRVLRFGPVADGRRFPSWRLGDAFSATPAAIAAIADTAGDAAVEAFHCWLRESTALVAERR